MTETYNPVLFLQVLSTALQAIGEAAPITQAESLETGKFYYKPDWAPVPIARFFYQSDIYLMQVLESSQRWRTVAGESDLWKFVEQAGLHFARLSIEAALHHRFHEPPDPDPDDTAPDHFSATNLGSDTTTF